MSGIGFLGTLMSLVSGGVSMLLGAALVVVGLVQVRNANAMAGLALAGAGATLAVVTLFNNVSLFVLSSLGSSMFVVSQVVSLLGAMAEGGLAVIALYLLATSLKEGR